MTLVHDLLVNLVLVFDDFLDVRVQVDAEWKECLDITDGYFLLQR